MERSTKGEKIVGKITGPIFPRLHVDDTKKIGPRAPPRNKMALYEQLSIPSQRFSNTTSTLPPPPIYGRLLTNTSSSSQGVGTEKGMRSPFLNSCIQVYSNEGILEKSSGNSIKRSMSALPEIEGVAESGLPTLTFRPFLEPCNLSQFKLPKYEGAGLKLPTLLHPPNNQYCSTIDLFQVGASCSLELQTSSPNKSRPSKSINIQDQDPQATQGSDKSSIPIVQVKDDKFSKISLKLDFTEEELSKVSELLPNGQHKKNKELNQSGFMKDQVHMNLSNQRDKICRDDAISEDQKGLINNNGASVLRSHEFMVNTQNSVNGNQHEEKVSTTCQVKFECKSEDRSHTPVKDCASCIVISPDVLVKMIGEKHFWQARKAIINQQRIFSMQVFELHRIVKVQRMLMDTGSIQQTEDLPFSKSLVDQPFMTEVLPESFSEAPLWHDPLRNEHRKTKLAIESLIGKPPELFPLSSDTKIVAPNSLLNFSKPENNNLSMWGVTPPGNQWLLPVFSPSEGLIYKPYPHHHPPARRGVLGTLYNECGPANITIPNEEFISSSTSGVCSPAPLDPANFAPYGMHMNNPFASGSPIKQTTALTGVNNFGARYPIDKNMGGVKDTEKLQSATSDPKKIRASNDALPLFPITPTSLGVGKPVQSCNTDQQKPQVIKVIPRNPKLASESAARIVKLIQEERKHYCN